MTMPPDTMEPNSRARNLRHFGDKSLENIIRTDERYGHDGLFQGPRGACYWKYLESPKPIQNANLWTDMQSTYFLTHLSMPAGSSLTLCFTYPYARYFKFALYRDKGDTIVSIGEDLAGPEIEPDPGSTNPFSIGADRQAEPRTFTIRLLAADPPTDARDREKNTLYAGRKGGEFQALIRIYLPDQGYDGPGWGPANAPYSGPGLPTYEGALADGTKLTAQQVAEQFGRRIAGGTQVPLSADQWYALVNASDNDPELEPASAPARVSTPWEVFQGINYTVVGAFKSPEERARIGLQTAMEGGGDPTTVYLITTISRKFGPIYVFQARLPTYPDTYAGTKVRSDGQVQYWSVGTFGAAPSGQMWDGLTDMMVPVDEQGCYTIVVSRPEDRPANATTENGVAWLDWGRGDCPEEPRNRADYAMLGMRFMACQPDWEHSPARATRPGMEESVLGPYYPRGYYTTREEFEAEGVRRQGRR
jgi:hypothetical protein